MPGEETSNRIIQFSDKKADWENLYKKFLSFRKLKDYKKLLISSGSIIEVEKILIHVEYEVICELSELAYEDLMFSSNTN